MGESFQSPDWIQSRQLKFSLPFLLQTFIFSLSSGTILHCHFHPWYIYIYIWFHWPLYVFSNLIRLTTKRSSNTSLLPLWKSFLLSSSSLSSSSSSVIIHLSAIFVTCVAEGPSLTAPHPALVYITCIWVRSRRCGCLVTWFCYQMIAKPGNKTATPLWPDPYVTVDPLGAVWFWNSAWWFRNRLSCSTRILEITLNLKRKVSQG